MTTQRGDQTSQPDRSGKGWGTRGAGLPIRRCVLGGVVALLLTGTFGWSGLSAVATGSSGTDAAVRPVAAQAADRCRIPTDEDRAM